jgi:hypothetical protein
MKSPWQIGLLAFAVTGVSAYDYIFLKNRNGNKRPATEIHVTQPASGVAVPLLAPLPEPVGSEIKTDDVPGDLRPAISLDELHALSRHAFVMKESSDSVTAYSSPERGSFKGYPITEKPVRRSPSTSKIKELPDPAPLPAPQCVFSGTLIQGRKQLALVNGMPLTIGDRFGIWTLARIESDYIVLESGAETHQIELKSTELRSVRRKDPS